MYPFNSIKPKSINFTGFTIFLLDTSCILDSTNGQVSNNLNLLEVFFGVNPFYSLKHTGCSFSYFDINYTISLFNCLSIDILFINICLLYITFSSFLLYKNLYLLSLLSLQARLRKGAVITPDYNSPSDRKKRNCHFSQ